MLLGRVVIPTPRLDHPVERAHHSTEECRMSAPPNFLFGSALHVHAIRRIGPREGQTTMLFSVPDVGTCDHRSAHKSMRAHRELLAKHKPVRSAPPSKTTNAQRLFWLVLLDHDAHTTSICLSDSGHAFFWKMPISRRLLAVSVSSTVWRPSVPIMTSIGATYCLACNLLTRPVRSSLRAG